MKSEQQLGALLGASIVLIILGVVLLIASSGPAEGTGGPPSDAGGARVADGVWQGSQALRSSAIGALVIGGGLLAGGLVLAQRSHRRAAARSVDRFAAERTPIEEGQASQGASPR